MFSDAIKETEEKKIERKEINSLLIIQLRK